MIRMNLRALAMAALLLGSAATNAEHQRTADGLVLNLGIVEASKLKGYAAEAGHGEKVDANAHHLLISVSDAKTGAHLRPASVVVAVIDPKGGVQRKQLKPGATAGVIDYSEVFNLGWAGDYRIEVTVEPTPGARRVTTRFRWKHHV